MSPTVASTPDRGTSARASPGSRGGTASTIGLLISLVYAELRTARLTGLRVAVPGEAVEARLAGLPEGVTVEAGRIELRFAGEAVVRLFALAQALTGDYAPRSWSGNGGEICALWIHGAVVGLLRAYRAGDARSGRSRG